MFFINIYDRVILLMHIVNLECKSTESFHSYCLISTILLI